VLVSGSECTGHEGAVRYVSGFRIVHRYAHVLVPVDGDPTIVFPLEARWVGRHADTWIEDQVFAEHPGRWLHARLRGGRLRRIGVYGLDFVMPVPYFTTIADGSIEHPRIGAGVDVPLRESMVVSIHPHVISDDEQSRFFMQDTWVVGRAGAEVLSRVPIQVYGDAAPADRSPSGAAQKPAA
jgi:hypothetical protein